MVSDETIKQQIPFALDNTHFSLPGRYQGKVRDNYSSKGKRILITTDRISAFDKVLTTIPFKGQVLNQCSAFWFESTKDIIQNQVIEVPDPNVIIAKEGKVYPIEMVVRGYLTGSAWRDYQAGKSISGIKLPSGMKKDQKFPTPLLTPSTKADTGHDMPISREEIIAQNIIPQATYERMEKVALALFARGTTMVAKQGLILVDTKYEFADFHGELIIVDEMHTPDCSRYWYADTYAQLFSEGKDQRMLDKEYLRQWLIREKNFMGDGPIPVIPDNIKVEVAKCYIKAYEEITGKPFDVVVGPVLERMTTNLKKKGYL